MAVSQEFVSVVRVLADQLGDARDRGKAVNLAQGAVPRKLSLPLVRILQLLVATDGEEKRSEWANTYSAADTCCTMALA